MALYHRELCPYTYVKQAKAYHGPMMFGHNGYG